jgi:hypothetical protein
LIVLRARNSILHRIVHVKSLPKRQESARTAMSMMVTLLRAAALAASAAAAASSAVASSSAGWAAAPPDALVFSGGGDFFGSSIAWGAPGGLEMLVSRPGGDAVDLWRRANDSATAPWVPASTLNPTLRPPASGPCSTVVSCRFGAAIATAANGTLLAIGAPGAAENGVVFLYARSSPATPGKAWSLLSTLAFPSGGGGDPNESFGDSLALSEDGAILLVGAPNDAGFSGVLRV